MIRMPAGVAALAAATIVLGACATKPVAPAVPQWQTIGQLAHPRAWASAVALPDGRILVVGGLDRSDPSVMNSESELIDPQTGAVTVLPQQLLGRLHQTVTSGSDVVIVAGGVEWKQTYWAPVDEVDIFHPYEGKWTRGASLVNPRSDHAAVQLNDGRIFVIGGNADTTLLASTEIYDPKTDRWTVGAMMPRPRTQLSAVTLIDGRVMVAGGLDSDGAATDTTFFYDPDKDEWTYGPRMVLPRLQSVVVALKNGDVLFAGGDGPASGTSEIFDYSEDRFMPSGTLAYPRLDAQGAALSDGRVVIAGGLPPRMNAFTPLSSAEIWDPATRQWSPLPPPPTARAWGLMVTVKGVVYQLSGTGDGEAAYQTIERLAFN